MAEPLQTTPYVLYLGCVIVIVGPVEGGGGKAQRLPGGENRSRFGCEVGIALAAEINVLPDPAASRVNKADSEGIKDERQRRRDKGRTEATCNSVPGEFQPSRPTGFRGIDCRRFQL
jgi:hypothetical protein